MMIFGQVFGVFLAVLSFFVYVQKTRKKILITKLSLDVLNIFQNALVGAFTGAVINGIAVFREVVFYYKENKKWAQAKIWLFVFVVLTCIAPFVSWQGWVSLLPAFGSSLVVVGFYCKNSMLVRGFGVAGHSFWVVYSSIIFNLGGILGSGLCILGGLLGIINESKNKKGKGER